ncbi:hypothetical protein DFH06DRAFT_1488994 [Mycena polygramma]|nr:hypothetical protein DFH06DRAFT_1488994 [Mycena polygramma]
MSAHARALHSISSQLQQRPFHPHDAHVPTRILHQRACPPHPPPHTCPHAPRSRSFEVPAPIRLTQVPCTLAFSPRAQVVSELFSRASHVAGLRCSHLTSPHPIQRGAHLPRAARRAQRPSHMSSPPVLLALRRTRTSTRPAFDLARAHYRSRHKCAASALHINIPLARAHSPASPRMARTQCRPIEGKCRARTAGTSSTPAASSAIDNALR